MDLALARRFNNTFCYFNIMCYWTGMKFVITAYPGFDEIFRIVFQIHIQRITEVWFRKQITSDFLNVFLYKFYNLSDLIPLLNDFQPF